MTNLNIRRLDSHIYKQLQLRAKKNGISMEEEVRRILTTAATPSEPLGNVFKRLLPHPLKKKECSPSYCLN